MRSLFNGVLISLALTTPAIAEPRGSCAVKVNPTTFTGKQPVQA